MPDVIIRLLDAAEKPAVTYPLLGYAFFKTPPLPPIEEVQQYLEHASIAVLFEEGKAVSMAAATPMIQNVRGRLFPAQGVWGVATLPEARRKGYSRRVMAHLLAAGREAGYSLSVLYAFRESFYERLGYTLFPQPRQARFSPLALTPLLKINLGGSIEYGNKPEIVQAYRTFLANQRQRTHGMALWDVKPDENQTWPSWIALARVNGQVIGAMSYTNDQTESHHRMIVHHFDYITSQGRYLLLEWLARHADQVEVVEIKLPPFEQPETWLSNLDVQVSSIEPALGRVMDVKRIEGMQTSAGSFFARIHDPLCSWNEGCYRFETIDGMLTVRPGSDADCDLTIQALSSLVYGTRDPGDFVFHGWGNPSPETQATLRAMFPRLLPYLHERF